MFVYTYSCSRSVQCSGEKSVQGRREKLSCSRLVVRLGTHLNLTYVLPVSPPVPFSPYAPKHLNKEPGVSAYDAHLGESAKGIDFKAIYNATGTVSERRKIKGIKMNKMSSKAILLAKLKENKGKTAQQRKVEMNRAKAMAGAAKKKKKKG